jgi:hypothetical protein
MNSRVFANERHLSGFISGYTLTHQRAYGDVTTIVDTGERWLPGLLGGALALTGPFDSDPTGLYAEALSSAGLDDGLLVTAMPDAFTVGQPAFISIADIESITVDAKVTDPVGLMISAKPDSGVDWGLSLHTFQAETVDGNSTGVDNLASSAGGAVASLHVTAYSGFTNVVFKVQHSVDNSVWTDLITFTTITAVGAELKRFTGTVNRYLRGFWDVTGSGSVTFAIAAARR